MNDQSTNKTIRKSFRSSQTPRFFISFEKIFCFILVLTFIMCLCIKKEKKQQTYPFPINHQQNTKKLSNFSIIEPDKVQTKKQQIQKYCMNEKCHKGEVQVLQLIANMIKDKVVQNQTIPNHRVNQKESNLTQADVQLPLKLKKQPQNQHSYENLLEYALQAVQNQQLTTQKQQQRGYLGLFLELITPYDPYNGINCLFHNLACSWEPSVDNALITVQSNQKIRPKIIEIESKMETTTKVQVVGLIFTTKSELIGIQLGKFELNKGLNWLQCKRSYCLEQYSMILVKIEKMSIAKLRIYQKLVF